jgi:hypothetical protein
VPDVKDYQDAADRHWSARDYPEVASLLTEVQSAAAASAAPEDRARYSDVIRRFVSPERLNILMLDFIGGALPPDVAHTFWNFVPDDVMWPILIDTWGRLPDGDTRRFVLGALRDRIATNMDLLRQTLGSSQTLRVRAALELLDESTERLFAADLLRLATHEDEEVRSRVKRP